MRMYDGSSAIIARNGKKKKSGLSRGKSHPAGSREHVDLAAGTVSAVLTMPHRRAPFQSARGSGSKRQPRN